MNEWHWLALVALLGWALVVDGRRLTGYWEYPPFRPPGGHRSGDDA